jgi:glycosyltransferase involved in cell wall biosynthesis
VNEEARQRPLRVLFTLGSLDGGGAERRLVELLAQLDRARFAPAVYLMERRGALLADIPGDVPLAAWSTPGRRLPWTWRALGYFQPSTARAWHLVTHLHAQPADIVVGWMLQSASEAVSAARESNIPLIACSVVAPELDLPTAFGEASVAAREQARRTFAAAARVVVNSLDLRSALAKFYELPVDHVTAIPNLRDFALLDRRAIAYEPEWPVAGPRVLAMGRLQPQKGFRELIRAFAQLNNSACSLKIIGAGPQRDELVREIATLNLQDRVRLPGAVDNPLPYLRTADLFVLASTHEGLPNVLLEALALGTPVVATDCPTGPRELLEGGRWGRLTPVGDVPALADAMAHTLAEPEVARATAREAAVAVRSRHDVATGVTQWETLLEQVAVEHRLRKGHRP